MNKCYSDVKAFMLLGQPDLVSGELRAPQVGGAACRFAVTSKSLREAAEFFKLESSPVFKDGRSNATLLGARLMTEELGEVLVAAEQGDLVEFADGLADLVYVTIWTAIAHGIDLPAVWAEVQRSNMGKFPECTECGGDRGVLYGAGEEEENTLDAVSEFLPCPACSGLGRVVTRDASGKIQKPPGWTPPDVKGVLARSK